MLGIVYRVKEEILRRCDGRMIDYANEGWIALHMARLGMKKRMHLKLGL